MQLGDGEFGDGILILSSSDNRVQSNTVRENFNIYGPPRSRAALGPEL